jgi:nitroimidazol reductase NimA-like FMN-containing flavoprotein (pyridoxamine 5'-phosphate oxidase superfamily)
MEEYADQVRRKDRQVTDIQVLKNVLHHAVSCSIAIEKEGYPLIHVAFFDYNEINHEIIFHFSKYGHAGQEIRNGKKACVSIYQYGKLYTAHQAVDFGCEYQSVIIYGTINIVEDQADRMLAMDSFFSKYFHHIPKHEYEPFTALQANPIHVAKIKIDDWLMKEHRVPETALRSFYPDASPILQPL